MNDIEYMKEAFKLAQKSFDRGEVPVGAVLVCDDKIIACGENRREELKNALCHAEIEAINNGCKVLGGWRLCNCTLYVTLEPCPMCTGAIINSRIERVVFGAYDKKAGSCGSVVNLFDFPYNHHPQVTGGILEEECSKILKEFFYKIRHNKN